MITKVLIIASIICMVCTITYCFIMLRRNWDVLIQNRKKLALEVAGMSVMMILQVIAYSNVYASGIDNEWVGITCLIASLLLLLAWIMLFVKVRHMKQRSMELLETLICVMEAGDPNLDGHSLHVHNLVELFYDYLPSKYQQQINYENLKYASLFLDMGKLGIPRKILTKSGKLTAEEMALMKRHPEICVKIVEPLSSFSMISSWILYHHERVDGKGYHGLKGNEIPLASRIITIADTYSALTMDRTYKASMTYDDAVIELRQAAGTQLDEELVGYFCEIPKHRIEECMMPVRKIMKRYHDEHFAD
ncbi:MAG: HD domain-containing protein [Lachnospiraceae bacterium]|nr:HD domain-containing protein [Lachnospiraceae bacterium]